MSKSERIFFSVLFALIALIIGIDVFFDANEGASAFHIGTEVFVALCAIFGLAIIIRDSQKLRQKLQIETRKSIELSLVADKWRNSAKTYIDGLSAAISEQLKSWALTESETEIAFLLLKGLSLKEIANIRGTSEKTIRAQATSIYSKSGLMGRAELSAFFLEDLLG